MIQWRQAHQESERLAAEKDEEAKRLTEALANLKTEVNSNEENVGKLNDAVRQKDTELEQLREELKQREAEISDMETKIGQIRDEVDGQRKSAVNQGNDLFIYLFICIYRKVN